MRGSSAATGVDLDLGMILDPRSDLSFGLSAQNVLPSNLGALTWGTGYEEKLPINLKFGTSYALADDLTILADYDSLGVEHLGGEVDAP